MFYYETKWKDVQVIHLVLCDKPVHYSCSVQSRYHEQPDTKRTSYRAYIVLQCSNVANYRAKCLGLPRSFPEVFSKPKSARVGSCTYHTQNKDVELHLTITVAMALRDFKSKRSYTATPSPSLWDNKLTSPISIPPTVSTPI